MADTQHYWRWSEKTYQSADLDWRQASAITVGIDVGSVSSQAVIFADGKLPRFQFHPHRVVQPGQCSARVPRGRGADGAHPDDVSYAVGTGYGRVNVAFADRTITEIACHARGANHMGGPSMRTILDMGGQDCKVIRIDERGKVLNFIMNDKCAAGTGRGMEVIADVLSVPIEDIGRRSFEIDEEPAAVSNVCTVFAKSEATSLLRAGWSVNKVLAAYCAAMAQRVAGLIERMEVEREFFITGGIGKNVGSRGGSSGSSGWRRSSSPRIPCSIPRSRAPWGRRSSPIRCTARPRRGGCRGEQAAAPRNRPARSREPRADDRQLSATKTAPASTTSPSTLMRASIAPAMRARRRAPAVSTLSRWTTTTTLSRSWPRRPASACVSCARYARPRTARGPAGTSFLAPARARACPPSQLVGRLWNYGSMASW